MMFPSRRQDSDMERLTEAGEEEEPISASLPLSIHAATGADPSLPDQHPESSSSSSSSHSGHHSTGSGKHCHEYSPKEGKSKVDWKSAKRLIIALCLCTAFMICEVVGGVLANSLAIATDAAHLLTDIISFGVSLAAIYLAGRPATRTMTYGWARTEVVGALMSVLLIYVVTGVLVYMAAMRIVHNNFDIDAKIMLITASLGIVVNIIMGIALGAGGHGHSHGGMSSGHGHSHGNGGSHGHSHGKDDKHKRSVELNSLTSSHKGNEYGAVSNGDMVESGKAHEHKEEDKQEPKSRENLNIRAAFIHVIGDLFQSIGVLAAALVIYFKPEWKLADPICTFVFSIIVLVITGGVLRDALNMLLEGAPAGLPYEHVLEVLQTIPGVKVVHDLRLWSLSPNKPAISVHLVVDDTVEEADVLQASLTAIHDQLDIHQVTIQIERYVDEMKDCQKCYD